MQNGFQMYPIGKHKNSTTTTKHGLDINSNFMFVVNLK